MVHDARFLLTSYARFLFRVVPLVGGLALVGCETTEAINSTDSGLVLSDTGAATGGATGVEGEAGSICDEELEPNDWLNVRDGMAHVGCSTANEVPRPGGDVLGPDDEDWVYVDGMLATSASCPQPANGRGTVWLTEEAASAGARVCFYMDCLHSETTEVTCTTGTADEHEGMPGCCSGEDGMVQFEKACPDATDRGEDLFIRVFQEGDACIPYTFSITY